MCVLKVKEGWVGVLVGLDMDWVGSEGESVPPVSSKASLPSIDRGCSVQLLRRRKVSRSRILRFQLEDVISCCLLIVSYRKVEE